MQSTETALHSRWSEEDSVKDQATTMAGLPHFKPIRFSTQGGALRHFTSPDFRIRRSSTPSNPKGSEKGRPIGKGQHSLDSGADVLSLNGYDTDPFASHPNAMSSFTSYETHSRTTSHSTIPKKRGSLLVAASDVLGFKFGRRHKSIQYSPMPVILPDVIEISAPRRDEEVEERERLRDAAAQSIGLDPILMSREDSPKEKENDLEDIEGFKTSESHLDTRSPLDSSVSDATMLSLEEPRRKTSQYTHSRSNSSSMTIPAFPSSTSDLAEFTQISSTLSRYYPPTSLRLFSLSKHWKNRFLILSSPPSSSSSRGPAVSYLHLFKSSGTEEKELERLEINEDSVVFVAEEDVGSRKGVVKVGGMVVGALKREHCQAKGQVMWFLQIVDPFEAQKWIAVIKNAVLGQRSLRAGLGIPVSTLGSVEPRGDMDVMLTMRAQGILQSPTLGKFPPSHFSSSRSLPSTVPHPFATADQNCASSISSNSSRSQAPSPKSPPSTVSTLKGLFTGVGRPRSPSRSESIDEGPERVANEESFSRMGNNLLNMMRSNGPSDIPPLSLQLVPSRSNPTMPIKQFSDGSFVPDRRLDRRIFSEYGCRFPPTELSPKSSKTLSLGALSLQPAPRKRSCIVGPPSSPDPSSMYNHTNSNRSVAGNFGIGNEAAGAGPHADITPTGPAFGTPENARTPSLHSDSTFASGDNGSGRDRSNSSTNTKRWSRQGSLPKRSTPPSGPLPLAPTGQSSRMQNDHPYSPEEGNTWQSSSSSQVSVVSGLPSFSKRGSNSSGMSLNNSNALQFYANGHPANSSASSHRVSVPPPRPIPNFAPPPAPDHDDLAKLPKSVPAPKASLRDSVAHRAFRLSLNAPKPPPTTVLPPRPDEPEYHRISTGSSGHTQSSDLYPITASPLPTVSPLPPPTYPIPPTPSSTSVSRNTSIKQRLRILSAPSQPVMSPVSESPPARALSSTTHRDSPRAETYSPPATPIGEPITHHQNDPSFLQFYSPITPMTTNVFDIRPTRRLPAQPEQNDSVPEFASLPPPPRRGSKQLSILDTNMEGLPGALEVRPTTQGEEKLISLSQQGSVISLGIVTM